MTVTLCVYYSSISHFNRIKNVNIKVGNVCIWFGCIDMPLVARVCGWSVSLIAPTSQLCADWHSL